MPQRFSMDDVEEVVQPTGRLSLSDIEGEVEEPPKPAPAPKPAPFMRAPGASFLSDPNAQVGDIIQAPPPTPLVPKPMERVPPGLQGPPMLSNTQLRSVARGLHPGRMTPEPEGETPAQGWVRAGAGVERMVKGKGDWRDNLVDVLEGGGVGMMPAVPFMAAAAPAELAFGLALGTGLQYGTEAGLDAAGVDPKTSRLAGTVAGFAPVSWAGTKGAARGFRNWNKPGVEPPAPRPTAGAALPEVLAQMQEAPPATPEVFNQMQSAPPARSVRQAELDEAFGPLVQYERLFDQADRRYASRPEVPETGVPENVARAMDARQRIAREVAGKNWEDLTNPERLVVDDLIAEGNVGAPVPPSRPAPVPRPALQNTRPVPKRHPAMEAAARKKAQPIQEPAPPQAIQESVAAASAEGSAPSAGSDPIAGRNPIAEDNPIVPLAAPEGAGAAAAAEGVNPRVEPVAPPEPKPVVSAEVPQVQPREVTVTEAVTPETQVAPKPQTADNTAAIDRMRKTVPVSESDFQSLKPEIMDQLRANSSDLNFSRKEPYNRFAKDEGYDGWIKFVVNGEEWIAHHKPYKSGKVGVFGRLTDDVKGYFDVYTKAETINSHLYHNPIVRLRESDILKPPAIFSGESPELMAQRASRNTSSPETPATPKVEAPALEAPSVNTPADILVGKEMSTQKTGPGKVPNWRSKRVEIPVGPKGEYGTIDKAFTVTARAEVMRQEGSLGQPTVPANGKIWSVLDRDGKVVARDLTKKEAIDFAKSAAAPPPTSAKLSDLGTSPYRQLHERGSISSRPLETSPNFQNSRENFIKKMDLSPETEQAFRQSVGKWEQANPERRAIGLDEIRQKAAEIGGDDLVRHLRPMKEGEVLAPDVYRAADDQAATLQREIYRREQELASKREGMPSADIEKAEGDLGKLRSDLDKILNVIIPVRSQYGRNLRYLSMMAKESFDPAYWLRAARKAKNGDLTPSAEQGILGVLREGQAAVDAATKDVKGKGRHPAVRGGATPDQPLTPAQQREVNADPRVRAAREKLTRTMAELHETGWWEMLTALRKAGLLTGVKTHLRNIGGNLAFQGAEAAAQAVGSIADVAIGMYKQQRTLAMPSNRGFSAALRRARTDGVRKSMEILRKGGTAEDLAKVDGYREINFQKLGKVSKGINAYINGTFRLLSAEDRMFREFIAGRSIWDQAKVIALNEAKQKKIDPKLWKRRMTELAENPTEAMAMAAIEDAEFGTFNNQNWLATGVEWAKSGIRNSAARLDGKRGHLGAKTGAEALVFGINWVLPFVRTPANIGARMFDYSLGAPVKVVYHGAMAMAKGMSAERQHAISQAIGRGTVGWGLMLLGYYMASEGKATGTGKKDAAQRNVEEAAGRRSGSVKLGGKWHQISPLAPAGNLIAMGASLYEKDMAPKSPGFAGDLLTVGAETVLDQPMLQGPSEMVDALKNPEKKGEKLLANAAGSMVPTLVSDAATLIDPTRKEMPTSIGQGFMSRLPFLRQYLPDRIDVLADPLEATRGAAVNPLLSSSAKEDTDPAMRELVRLKIGLSTAPARKEEPENTTRVRRELRGILLKAAVRETVNHPVYNEAPDDVKTAALKESIDRAQQKVTDLMNEPEVKAMNPAQREALLADIVKMYRTPTRAAR